MLLSQSRRAFHWLFCRPFLLGGKLHETITAWLPLHGCPILDKFCDVRSDKILNKHNSSIAWHILSVKQKTVFLHIYTWNASMNVYSNHTYYSGIACLKNGKVKHSVAQYIVGCPMVIKAPSDCLLDTAALISNVSSVSWILEMQLIEPSHVTK